MRWILVFILLYLIPLMVLFKNYKVFKRACVYGSIYVVLCTTLIITNTYMSGLKIIKQTLEYDDVALETYSLQNFSDLYEESSKEMDLKIINKFKEDIYSIERIALTPMRECVPYTNNLQKTISNLNEVKDDVVYAKDMCEKVSMIYDEMKVPSLSKEEYTDFLRRAKLNVKKSYELRMLAMENCIMLIDTKNPMYINKIKSSLRLSDKEIESFKMEINQLKKVINK